LFRSLSARICLVVLLLAVCAASNRDAVSNASSRTSSARKAAGAARESHSARTDGKNEIGARRRQPTRWIRTVDGWELRESLSPPAPSFTPALHPLVVAAAELLLSLAALTAFAPPAHRRGFLRVVARAGG